MKNSMNSMTSVSSVGVFAAFNGRKDINSFVQLAIEVQIEAIEVEIRKNNRDSTFINLSEIYFTDEKIGQDDYSFSYSSSSSFYVDDGVETEFNSLFDPFVVNTFDVL